MKRILLTLLLFAPTSIFAKFINGFIENKDTIHYEKGKLNEDDKEAMLKIYNEIKNTDSKDPLTRKKNKTFYHYQMRGGYMDFLVTDDPEDRLCPSNPKENLQRIVNRALTIGIYSILGLVAFKVAWDNLPSSFIDSFKNLFSTYTKNAQ